MKNLRKTPSTFSLYLLLMLAAMVAFVASFVLYARAEGQLERANETRLKSTLLAQELRQSSNDLTRLVRTYVITGQELFKRQFEQALAIRYGTAPRPPDYGPSYWDFHAEGLQGTSTTGQAIPLLDLMRQAGFTDQEFAKLAESKANSDALAGLELAAIALVEADRPPDPAKRLKAIQMLHDDRFHHAKVDIMQPISEFDGMVNQRTLQAVQKAEASAAQMRLALVLLGLLLLFLLWKINRQLYAILGCSVPELHETIARLGSGDFAATITVPPQRQDSVLAWLAETQEHLAKLELRQYKAIVDSTDDAIISKTLEGIISSWNPGAERTFGYRAEEVIGQPMQMLIPADRTSEEPEILARIARGERVSHFETVRRHKNGQLIDISSTISPVQDERGVVIGASTIARDITHSKESEREIHRLAYYDPLTQLPNRRLFQDRLEHALVRSRRSHQCCAILFIDLDNFKTLNDTQGHDVGDVLLQQVAQRLLACVRLADTVTRLGGDEFVVMLEGLGENSQEAAQRAELVGEKILASLNQAYPLEGHLHHCTPSIGVALSVGDATASDVLLKQADLAMYRAKASGRNTLRFFDPEMQTSVDHHALLERDLRKAVAAQQFELHYQAQVGPQGRLQGAEALLRWHHPERGRVSPAEFIPVAETSGLILSIGHWVLETACERLAHWATVPALEPLTISVNVSARQFHQAHFVDEVLGLLDRTGARPQRLKLELTESMLATSVEEIIHKMLLLRARGVHFSLDDFGTGYSSLSYLKRLPLDQLKIDQGFVKDILTDPNDAAIAQMVVALAQSLGIEVIAEGVEIEAQQARLAELGCYVYQGYLFSRPLPLAEFEAFVRAQAPPTEPPG
ncbi:MAG: EAL domain-containing protein [Burkholderiaceae bacterium]|nr:EAL domain-containing protein [Burkholderiaceae bacterium]